MEIAAAAMQNDTQRLAHISQNLANVQTPGYKRTVSVQRVFSAEMDAAAATIEVAHDASAGTLRATDNALDLALDGEGFFAVQTEHGIALTRQAALRLDANGRVVNASGLPLLGERGELRAAPGGAALRVDAHGEVWADNRSLGRLQVLRAGDKTTLQALGGGLYRTAADDAAQPVASPKVMVGYQEASNVNSSSEMVRLMETTRHFEAMARTVQAYDEALEKAIHKLGDL
jgi:flagellar basal body rod protein FlgG